MLYDELVPKGEYLAHYGVPKDQWSPEAKARHNRKHPNKTVDPGSVTRAVRVLRDTYNEYREDNHNRGGNRSTFGSKVDEQRAQLAEARHNRNRNQHTGDQGNKPYSGQHTPNYRKPRGGQEPRQPNKPARDPGAKKDDSYAPYTISSRELVNSPYGNARVELRNRGKKPREWDPDATANSYHGKRSGNGKKPSSSKNAHTRSSYKPETTNEYSLSSRAKHSPEFDDAIRQMNAVDYALNRSGRNLREYSHNGQLVKQNPSLNRVAEFEGLEPNSLRVATKAGKRKSKSRRN